MKEVKDIASVKNNKGYWNERNYISKYRRDVQHVEECASHFIR